MKHIDVLPITVGILLVSWFRSKLKVKEAEKVKIQILDTQSND